MKITWEDRKNIGSIDDEILSIKPEFSFEYAWFLVNDETAQFVPTHEEGTYNEDMSEDMRLEVLDFYNSYIFEGIKPSYDENIEKLVEDGIEIIEGKKYKKYLIEPLTELELEQKRKESIPTSLTMRQTRLILLKNGMLEDVETTISLSEDKELQIEWEYASNIERNSPTVIKMQLALDVTDLQIDSMFAEASKL